MTKDEFSYLEETRGSQAQAWVKAQNERATRELEGDPRFQRYYDMALEAQQALTSTDSLGLIPGQRRMWIHRARVYQVWNDLVHPGGIWRRASLESFLRGKPEWEVLLDLDALNAAEHEDRLLVSLDASPNGRRVLVELKIEGLLTSAWREFDLERRQFVADGFRVPPSRSSLVWRDDDAVMMTSDLWPDSVNAAGTPVAVKLWRRGEPLADAREVFRGQRDDYAVSVSGIVDGALEGAEDDGSGTRVVHIAHTDGTFRKHLWRWDRNERLQQFAAAPLARSTPLPYKDHYLSILREDWQTGGRTWKRGSVVAIPAADVARAEPRVSGVFVPGKDTSVLSVAARTQSGALLLGSHLSSGRLWRAQLKNGAWTTQLVPLPDHGMILPEPADFRSEVVFVHYQGFLHPPSLYRVDVASNEARLVAKKELRFAADAFVAEQSEAKSSDGVLVPYTLVRPRNLVFDGSAPALVVGYGASGYTNFPRFSGSRARLWLEQGGVYVLANVRGGQERGSEWAVQGLERQHTYDDMVAVTEDLIRRRVATAKRIGFMGHSNGGLLGGVMLTQRPDLFGAVVLQAPLLDQFRMDLTAFGALPWLKEYGSPDIPRERAFLERTSPFQNLKAGASLPRPFLITSTTDETVRPAQARRFAAKMGSLGMPFLFYETAEGGHGMAVTLAQVARLEALIYVYLTRQLVDPRAR